MKYTTPEKRVRELPLVVARDDDDGALLGRDFLTGLEDFEAHAVELVKQVVRKLDIGLIHLVDQKDHALISGKGLSNGPQANVPLDILGVALAEAGVVKALNGVIEIKPI